MFIIIQTKTKTNVCFLKNCTHESHGEKSYKKQAGLGQLGYTEHELWIPESILSMLSFLILSIVLQLPKKMSLLLGNTYWSIWRDRGMMFTTYSQMGQKKYKEKTNVKAHGTECWQRRIWVRGTQTLFRVVMQSFCKFKIISNKK